MNIEFLGDHFDAWFFNFHALGTKLWAKNWPPIGFVWGGSLWGALLGCPWSDMARLGLYRRPWILTIRINWCPERRVTPSLQAGLSMVKNHLGRGKLADQATLTVSLAPRRCSLVKQTSSIPKMYLFGDLAAPIGHYWAEKALVTWHQSMALP